MAEIRIQEAQGLPSLPIPRPDGADYLAGYAVECALKAAIAKLTNQHDWPEKKFVFDCHTRNVMSLVELAQLKPAQQAAANADQNLALNWSIVKDWNEGGRYERHSPLNALTMVNAVIDPLHGVLPWIRGHW